MAVIILDEAGMTPQGISAIITCLAALDAAVFILIGDPAQLPAVLRSSYAKAMGADISVQERVMDYFMKDPFVHVELNRQYRMNPMLAAFPSSWSYEGKLLSGITAAQRAPPLGVAWTVAQGGWHFPIHRARDGSGAS